LCVFGAIRNSIEQLPQLAREFFALLLVEKNHLIAFVKVVAKSTKLQFRTGRLLDFALNLAQNRGKDITFMAKKGQPKGKPHGLRA